MFNKDYCNNVKHNFKKNSYSRPGYDGLVVHGLLAINNNSSRFLLNHLLKAFQSFEYAYCTTVISVFLSLWMHIKFLSYLILSYKIYYWCL